MPVAYSNDLCWRIVWLNVLLEVTAQDVAKVIHVSERTVYRYADRYRRTGEVRPLVKRNGPARLLCEFEELLLVQLILAYPDYTLESCSNSCMTQLVAGLMPLPSAERCID